MKQAGTSFSNAKLFSKHITEGRKFDKITKNYLNFSIRCKSKNYRLTKLYFHYNAAFHFYTANRKIVSFMNPYLLFFYIFITIYEKEGA